MYNLKPIGYIQSCYKQKFGTPRQSGLVTSSLAKLKVLPEFQPEESLLGLTDFSHVWLIGLFHKNVTDRFHAKVHPPRLQGKTMGLFATRSPHRPNPLALSLVKLLAIEERDTLIFSGLDFIEGTPIFDIKPYLVDTESILTASRGWLPKEDLFLGFKIIISPEIQEQLYLWQQKDRDLNCEGLLKETLSYDPRPEVYKVKNKEGQMVKEIHAIRLGKADIFFRYQENNQVVIEKIIIVEE